MVLGHTETIPMTPHSFPAKEHSITYIGHATTLIHLDSVNVLTDPNFNTWCAITRRSRKAGMRLKDLPRIDLVLISHAHRDHLDEWTLEQLPKDVPVLISTGNGHYLREWGFGGVREVAVWDTLRIAGIGITATPAQHSGARNSPTADFPAALGYVLQADKTVYFAGDTALFSGFGEIGDRFQIDVALLPIGAYRPQWFMKRHHMGPQDVFGALEMLGAQEMIPIHWGSFRLAWDGIDEPKEVLLRLMESSCMEKRIRILENGQTHRF